MQTQTQQQISTQPEQQRFDSTVDQPTTTTIQQQQQQQQQNGYMDPDQYSINYYTLQQQQRQYYWPPQQYRQWYMMTYYQNINVYNQSIYQHNHMQGYNNNMSYGNGNGYQWPISNVNNNNIAVQKEKDGNKLSRNQKRKIKKKMLQQQYEEEKKKIGKWVDLQRKDLVQDIKKIQQQQNKLKQKRKQKLSHLIEIHKQIYKHMLKKNRGIVQSKREHVGNFRKKKKKPSHIKRMKQLYEEVRNGKIKQNCIVEPDKIIFKNDKKQDQKFEKIVQQKQEDYVTESQSETQKEMQVKKNNKQKNGKYKNAKNMKKQQKKNLKNIKQQMRQQQPQHELSPNKKQEQEQKEIKIINYNKVGKLTGYLYNGITLRQWVDHVPTAKLEDITLKLINRLAYKQAIKKINQPQKAKKLVISGFHECKRTLWTKIDKKRAHILIVALNIQRNNLEKGTDHQMQEVLGYAQAIKVPVIHISTRSKLGRAFTGKFGPRITMVSIINYEGYEDMVEALLEEHREARKVYDETNQYCFKF